MQPGGLRGEVVTRRVGAAHDRCQGLQRRLRQLVLTNKGIEAAPFAVMREPLGAGDVVGNGPGLCRNGEHPVSRHIEKFGIRLDEAADQPRTGDTVDLGVLARDPFRGHAALPGLPA